MASTLSSKLSSKLSPILSSILSPRFIPSRKVVFAVCALLLFIFTFRHLTGPAGLADAVRFHAKSEDICRIWPHWTPYEPIYGRHSRAKIPVVGHASILGDPNECLMARPRLTQYHPFADRNWSSVSWGEVQARCSAPAYPPTPSEVEDRDVLWHTVPPTLETLPPATERGRVAIVLRSWDDYKYTENRRAWLRALISETALSSGGDFEVFLLVDVKDRDIRVDSDVEAYERALVDMVPDEFRDMALLYNDRVLETWYPKIEGHRAQEHMYQPLQIFSHKFPQFTHVWQLEMDLRMTGHVGRTLQRARDFAVAQPRRNLWERSGRFYVPETYNHSYDAFTEAVDQEIGDDGVWGPVPTEEFEPKGPQPPPRSQLDWGVDEEPDLISFMPIFDPVGTDWFYENQVNGFAAGLDTPRRVALITMTRASRYLLQLASEAQRDRGQWVISEAMMATFSLLHGLKAVSVPQPITFSDYWTAADVEEDLNHGPPYSKAGGKSPSVMTKAPVPLIRGKWGTTNYWFHLNKAPEHWHSYLGGECMPSMLLHPVKDE